MRPRRAGARRFGYTWAGIVRTVAESTPSDVVNDRVAPSVMLDERDRATPDDPRVVEAELHLLEAAPHLNPRDSRSGRPARLNSTLYAFARASVDESHTKGVITRGWPRPPDRPSHEESAEGSTGGAGEPR